MRTPSLARQVLLPLTPVYRLALAAREMRLRRGWESVRRLRFPVISIGNLSTGGAGKTPFAIALAKGLAEYGFAVDVLSRGYGRTSAVPARVDPSGTAEEFGDEPLLIAREAGVPVYVARERYEAGLLAEKPGKVPKAPVYAEGGYARAEARSFPPFQNPVVPVPDDLTGCIHILDDGFQHRQLHRDLNILLLNGEDWHDRLLPAGNLREPPRAAERADVIAISHEDPDLEVELRTWGWKGRFWRLRRRMDVPPVEGPVVAFCGVARPEQFFAGLESAGLQLADRIVFRDHHRYSPLDLDRIQAKAQSAPSAALITTAKDYIRLAPLLNVLRPELPLLTAGLRIEIEDAEGAMRWLADRLSRTPVAPSL